jgi:hypothetical protein
MHRWWYKWPWGVYGIGPSIDRWTEQEFRAMLRSVNNLRRLPAGFQVWRA